MDVVSCDKAYQKVCDIAISIDTLSNDMVRGSIGAMDDVKTARLNNLKKLLLHRFNGVIVDLARAIDKDPNYTRFLLNPEKSGGRWMGEKIARHIEISLGLQTGEMDFDDGDQHLLIANDKTLPAVRSTEPRRHVVDRRDDDLIEIPLLDTFGSMGGGCFQPHGDDVVERITVSLSSLKRTVSVSNPDNLALITGYGDSMEGTFNDGDVLLVDRGVCETKLDAVYVLSLDGELYIKRIQRRPDGDLLMISDNKKYEPYLIKNGKRETFEVLGRVVMAWNARKL